MTKRITKKNCATSEKRSLKEEIAIWLTIIASVLAILRTLGS